MDDSLHRRNDAHTEHVLPHGIFVGHISPQLSRIQSDGARRSSLPRNAVAGFALSIRVYGGSRDLHALRHRLDSDTPTLSGITQARPSTPSCDAVHPAEVPDPA